ncbi:hypothetical protein MTO98_16125 [Mucilaginibacter sp. SMC90]|uniref:hypothetical protein n=1 Tax=Mucilaginibacter sp. SMC90 TaxID=2929803 RepID=UPI001FB45FAF|nr:hypothetical protein [Mucilaginibacter sp. SMC90]UOE52605.1 hypothetical protein MTO98_16125 [Mucilaginibacter sp. SMC90]
MDRINLKCLIADQEVDLQLDKKAMPGEKGPCFMITEEGCFKGYIALQKDYLVKNIGVSYYTDIDFQSISLHLKKCNIALENPTRK